MSIAKIRTRVREMFGIFPTLDLHGLKVPDALRETEQFLREAQESGIESVRIVYGKGRHSPSGRGVLRDAVTGWLDAHGRHLVRRYERRPDASGADGGIIVWVRVDEGD